MVLPGAFSAYRYIALHKDSTGKRPPSLQKYVFLLGESMVIALFVSTEDLLTVIF